MTPALSTKVMSSIIEVLSHRAEETYHLGKRLGELAKAGDVILLVGELGAGKTCLVQGIGRGLAISEVITSPSFIIVGQYRGRLTIYHIDLYRIDSVEEFWGLGLDEYLWGNGVCVVEWAEKFIQFLPPEHLLIQIHYVSINRRGLRLEATRQRYEELLSHLLEAPPSSTKARR